MSINGQQNCQMDPGHWQCYMLIWPPSPPLPGNGVVRGGPLALPFPTPSVERFGVSWGPGFLSVCGTVT